MGTEAAWVPMVLAAAAATTSEVNRRRTSKKQDQEAAAQIRSQAQKQKQADALINKQLDATADSSAEPFREQTRSAMQRALAANRVRALAGLQQSGAVSDAAKGYATTAAGSADDYANKLSGLFSIIDAAGDQRRAEGNMRGDLSMDLGRIGRESAGDEYIGRMKVAAIQKNPYLSALSAGLSGASQGMAMGGGG